MHEAQGVLNVVDARLDSSHNDLWAYAHVRTVNGDLAVGKTDDSGNAMFQSFLSKLFKKETG